MRQFTRSQLDYHRLLPFRAAQLRRNGGTAENIARWVCKQIPQCYKVEVQESEGNIVIYEKDPVGAEGQE